jgi:hypothetical protein
MAVGAVTMLEQRTMDDDGVACVWYVSGWQVHPAHRGRSVGPALARWAVGRCRELGGGGELGWFMTAGPARGLSGLVARLVPERRVARPRLLRSYRLRAAHWRSMAPSRAFVVRPAKSFDVEEMADVWRRAACARQLAPRLGAVELERWRSETLGTPPACYWVAHTPLGAILGFVGLWDQCEVKQYCLEPDPRADLLRRGAARARRLLCAGRADDGGLIVPYLAATHYCTAPDTPRVGRVLLARAARAAWLGGYRNIAVMADATDPLARICERWSAASQDFAACLVRQSGCGASVERASLPLHHDIGLA